MDLNFKRTYIDLLKCNVRTIFIGSSQKGPGYTITAVMKDGHVAVYPEIMNSLEEAAGCARAIAEIIGLPSEHIMVKMKAIRVNRLNDVAAFRISKALKRGQL